MEALQHRKGNSNNILLKIMEDLLQDMAAQCLGLTNLILTRLIQDKEILVVHLFKVNGGNGLVV